MDLLTKAKANAKLAKGQDKGYLLTGVPMYPDKEICPFASLECMDLCLQSAGRGKFNKTIASRKRKAIMFRDTPHTYFAKLVNELVKFEKKAKKKGLIPAVRLNLTSDIDYGRVTREIYGHTIFEMFPDIQWYDYTKDYKKALLNTIPNYDLTFSFNGHNWKQAQAILKSGKNVAFVFKHKLPKIYQGKLRQEYEVIDGDQDDYRFLDKKGVLVGLVAKGKAETTKIASSFVIDAQTDKFDRVGVPLSYYS